MPVISNSWLIKIVGAARFELATSWSQTRRDNRATLRPELISINYLKELLSAERVGVEPTVQCYPYDDLANRSFRPLRHLSKILSPALQAFIYLRAAKIQLNYGIPKTI
jgi:hypothetical protein